MMCYFVTYFDKNYLSRGLVLYDSLKKECTNFSIYILCLDDFTYDFFTANAQSYPEITPIPLEKIEEHDLQLKQCKSGRSKIEYYFTLSPCLPLFILEQYGLPHICSLDADILFLSNPAKLFNYLENYSVIITPHKFSAEIKASERYGLFNVSFQVFKNDNTGIACLKNWRNECIEWCGDHLDEKNGRFADQKYLDKWPWLYGGKLKILDDNISGIAPWNLNNYRISSEGGEYFSNSDKIIFYHFHYFKFFTPRVASNGLHAYRVKKQSALAALYLKYWNCIVQKNKELMMIADQSARYSSSANTLEKILNEDGIYYRLNSKTMLTLNFYNLPERIKIILGKIYGKITKS